MKFDSYTLVYNTAALGRYETAEGRPVYLSLTGVLGVRQIVNLVWAGMAKNHPAMSVSDVEDALDAYMERGGSIPDLMQELDDTISETGWLKRPTEGTPDSES